MIVKSDYRSIFSNLNNWKEEAWKKVGLQRDSNPWPPRYRCDALPTELWRHTLNYFIYIFTLKMLWWNLLLLLQDRHMKSWHQFVIYKYLTNCHCLLALVMSTSHKLYIYVSFAYWQWKLAFEHARISTVIVKSYLQQNHLNNFLILLTLVWCQINPSFITKIFVWL